MLTDSTPLLDADSPTRYQRSQKGQVLILYFVRTCETIVFTSIYTFVSNMIHELGVEAKSVGYNSGLIETAFAVSQFFTAYLWSRVSDKIGRRPVLMIGLSVSFITTVVFGLSDRVMTMVIAKAVAGSFSGDAAVIKTVASELSNESNQDRIFTILHVCYNIGALIGPLIGGTFSRPAQRYPKLFGKFKLLKTHSYALPCFISATSPLLGTISTWSFLKETRYLAAPSAFNYKISKTSVRQILTKRFVIYLISAGIVVGIDQSLLVINPLVAFQAPQHGGLGFSEPQIGIALTTKGMLTMASQFFIFPKLCKRVGYIRSYQIASASYAISFVIFPFVTWLARTNKNPILIWLSLFVVLSFQSLGAIYIVSVDILASEFATHRTLLGAYLGVVQSVKSLVMALVPLSSTSLYSVSLQLPTAFGGPANLFWLFMCSIAFAGLLSSFFISLPQVSWRDEDRSEVE